MSECDRAGGGPGPLGAVTPWGWKGEYVVFTKLLCGWQYLKSYALSFFQERFCPSCYMKSVSTVQSFESFCTRA